MLFPGSWSRCPLLAQSGHRLVHCTCPLSGVKRTCRVALHMSAFDPKRTLVTSYSASKSASFKWTWRRFVGGGYVRRRDFIIAIAGSAAAWPLATRAQQPTRVVGFLRPTKAEESGHLVAAVREGLRESGYPRDKVTIESRWGDGRDEQLPKLARELVALPVAAIVAGSCSCGAGSKGGHGKHSDYFRNRCRSTDRGARVQY